MGTWIGDGYMSAFSAAWGALVPKGVLFATNTDFTVPGVDVQAVLRTQYTPKFISTPPSSVGQNSTIYAVMSQQMTSANMMNAIGADTGDGWDIGATLFVLADEDKPSDVTGAPCYNDFKRAGVSKVKAYRSRRATQAELDNWNTADYKITGPSATALKPGTKYWFCLMGSQWMRNSTPSIVNDISNGSHQRIISAWTNRSPLAPVITSPLTGTVVNSGADVSFKFSPIDPDEEKYLGAHAVNNSYADKAGIQVQYAPRPTPENPNPEWQDLPWAANDGAGLGHGWYIAGSGNSWAYDTGIMDLWANESGTIRAGATTVVAGKGALPSGEWQLRMRTFDYGHPFPAYASVWGRAIDADGWADVTPDNAPAFNTSPWSKVVFLTISAQVPPPIPLSPVSNRAVPANQPVTLLWQYRNTAQVPKAQQSRTVQMRKVGDAAWTTLVSGNSGSQTYTVDKNAYPMTEHTQYEWRVQVTDTDGVLSNYSTIARFWIVPAPQSGEEKPVPDATIDGASLGCGRHRAFIYRRGGIVRVGEVTQMSHIDWGRTRDDISTAEVRVSGWSVDCGKLLSELRTWAYELVIFRDNGYSNDRVWEGPITLLTFERDKVTIQAKDVMAYAYRRIIKQEMNDQGVSVVDRATRILQNCIGPDDPNLLAYLTPLNQADDAKQYRKTPAYSRTAFEEIDDMAANAGLDYCAVGRAILLWGTKHRIGTLPEFRDEDLGAVPIVSEYGMSMANRYAVSDGNGVYGEADRLDENDEDKTFGLVEMLSSTWAQDADQDTGTYTEEGIETIRKSFVEFAERSIADRYPPPTIVRVPDGTSLNPDTVISIQQLVPGVVIPLRSVGTLREVRTSQKLDSIRVVQEGENEQITVTMSAFTRDDANQEATE